MKAEDRILKVGWKDYDVLNRHWKVDELLKAQDKITWDIAIKEVVEWIETHWLEFHDEASWQAQLKEWR